MVRGQDGAVDGFLALLDLTRASAEDIAADPGARAAWDYAQRQAPPRPSEAVTQSRFIIDREAYQGPSPTLNATPILTFQRYLGTPHLAWDFLTLAEPERWDDYFAAADLPRAVGADFVVGGRRYGLFAHDFRRVPMDALLELVTERALAEDVTPSPPAASRRCWSSPSPSSTTRSARRCATCAGRTCSRATRCCGPGWSRDRAGDEEPSAAALEALVCAAVETLREHPRDDKLWRAVERTYVRPAATQERAAAALGLPFSTYRRHLTQGVDRVVAWLWDQEVYGGGEQH